MVSGNVTPPGQRWFQRLLRPSWLAAAISVGFHGALFAAGPTFEGLKFAAAVEPELADENRQVPLIELSPEEQQRLPDFSQPFYNFDTFNSDVFGNFEPFAPLPEDDSDTSPLEQVPSPLTSERPPYTASTRLPFSIAPFESRRPINPPPLSGQGDRPSTDKPTDDSASAPGQPPAAGTGNSGELPDLSNQPSGEPGISLAEPSAADLELQPQDPTVQQTDDGSGAIAITRNPTEVMTPEERLEYYAYNPTATTQEEAEQRLENWLSEAQVLAETPELTMPDLVQLPMVYGEQICLPNPPHTGLIGALVSAEGELLGDPVVLKSTGYRFINRQASRFIRTLDFDAVDTPTAYRFTIDVEYDPEICVELGRGTRQSQEPGIAREEETDTEDDTATAEDDAVSSEDKPTPRIKPNAAPQE